MSRPKREQMICKSHPANVRNPPPCAPGGCRVALHRTMYLAPTADPLRSLTVRALACMFVNVEVVKGTKFLHEVHWTCPLPGACELSVLTRSPLPFPFPPSTLRVALMALLLTLYCAYSPVVTLRSSSWATDTASSLMKPTRPLISSGLETHALSFARQKSESRGVRLVPITEEKVRGLYFAMFWMSIILNFFRVISHNQHILSHSWCSYNTEH